MVKFIKYYTHDTYSYFLEGRKGGQHVYIANFVITTCSTLVHNKIIKIGLNHVTLTYFEKEIKVDNMFTIANFVVRLAELEIRPTYNLN
jgi:hypothetical protein